MLRVDKVIDLSWESKAFDIKVGVRGQRVEGVKALAYLHVLH